MTKYRLSHEIGITVWKEPQETSEWFSEMIAVPHLPWAGLSGPLQALPFLSCIAQITLTKVIGRPTLTDQITVRLSTAAATT